MHICVLECISLIFLWRRAVAMLEAGQSKSEVVQSTAASSEALDPWHMTTEERSVLDDLDVIVAEGCPEAQPARANQRLCRGIVQSNSRPTNQGLGKAKPTQPAAISNTYRATKCDIATATRCIELGVWRQDGGPAESVSRPHDRVWGHVK